MKGDGFFEGRGGFYGGSKGWSVGCSAFLYGYHLKNDGLKKNEGDDEGNGWVSGSSVVWCRHGGLSKRQVTDQAVRKGESKFYPVISLYSSR